MKKIVYLILFVFMASLGSCAFRTCPAYAKSNPDTVNSAENVEINS